jgi:hypothetical protein
MLLQALSKAELLLERKERKEKKEKKRLRLLASI